MTDSMADLPGSNSSPASSASSSPAPVLVKRSVKDLLAELSDSESESETRKSIARTSIKTNPAVIEQDDSSDEEVVLGGGRLAARLNGVKAAPTQDKPEKDTQASASGRGSSSEDELSRSPLGHAPESSDGPDFMPKKRLLLKRKRSDEDEQLSDTRPRDGSPTPTRSNPASSPPAVRSPAGETANAAAKSKFELLIEKARNERLAREAAEKAKKAARAAERAAERASASPKRKIQRGSSPADDTEEDSDKSDSGPSKKLTQAARPARKASKKALEEMNRETQRMNRNMQLAHQATTKKKFSKQGFFETFTRNPPMTSSSAPSSDSENHRSHSTPPTSPLREPETPKQTSTISDVQQTDALPDVELEDAPDFMAILEQRRKETEPGKITAVERSRPALNNHGDDHSDSGSDIEVVADKASKRKFVAFENLPKRKAQELPSHLVLRALAHVKKQINKKSSISAADMGPALLQAARNQAFEERKAKIEKLKAAGVVIQTAEEREMEEEELEDLVEKARLEDEEIRKREKELAKKDGTYVKDALDDDDSDEDDDDFVGDDEANSGSEDETEEDEEEGVTDGDDEAENDLIDRTAEESDEEAASETASQQQEESDVELGVTKTPMPSRIGRAHRLIVDDEDEDEVQTVQSPAVPSVPKTPHSILRSARKVIPGLEYSNSLPMGLTQAFAATMADSQTQEDSNTQEQDSMDILRDLPSPQVAIVPHLNRLESIDVISESVPNSQTQPLDLDLGFTQSQCIPESPAAGLSATQMTFDLTQDKGYIFSPFKGDRFAETPGKPHSTEDTILVPRADQSPIVTRKGRLQRGRHNSYDSANEDDEKDVQTAFSVMKRAAKQKLQQDFNKKKSEARGAVDEAAEESDDEYAGLGGASDDESGEENEEDRKMIDEDTQVGRGDEAKLAKLHADRERESDEAAVSKLLKDITTGGLRRKRGAADDLDLSDEEDATARRREAKRREFAKMRRELLKDEAVNKIADDQKKQAFLKSIEDHDDDDVEADNFDRPETQLEDDTRESTQNPPSGYASDLDGGTEKAPQVLQPKKDSQLNIGAYDHSKAKVAASRKPANLAEIRDSLSFLIEEPESQSGMVDLGLSDSEDEPEAYVNLDRHFQQAEADEEAMMDENEDLGDFVVADMNAEEDSEDSIFKKPDLPAKDRDRAPFSERRTKAAIVVDRLTMMRQSSSSTGSNASSKMAFVSGKGVTGSTSSVPSLLRRATTNSGLGSMSGRENVSATGVVTNKTERGSAAQEKDFVRKGANTSRNAINYQGRQNLKEEKMSARAGVAKKQQPQKKSGSFLNGLFRGDTWG